MRQIDFKTAYGARHYTLRSQFMPKDERFGDVSLDEAMQVIDKIGYDLHGLKTLPDNYNLMIGDQKRTLTDIQAMFQEKAPKLGLRAILDFEKDFERTIDPHQIISAQQTGDRDALMLIRRFSMFPTEGANVWGEFAIPEYARYQSRQLEAHIEALYVRAVGLVSLAGPIVPALEEDMVMKLLKEKLPKMKFDVLSAIADQPAPKNNYLN